MVADFSVWLQFSSKTEFITEYHNQLLISLANQINYPIFKQDISLHFNNQNYSYLINERIEAINGLLINYSNTRKYIQYAYAVNNLVTYIPDDNFSLDDIKGFNLMDYIFAPTNEVKTYIESKIPNINKVFLLPFNIEIIEKSVNPNEVILCINSNDLNLESVLEYLKLDNLKIYTDDNSLKLNKPIYNRSNLYNDLNENSYLIIDFYNDFYSSIIQKKAIINNIMYLGKKNNFSNIPELLDLNLSFAEKKLIAKQQINEYSNSLIETFSENNSLKIMDKYFNEILDNIKTRNLYLVPENTPHLSYNLKIKELITQIPENSKYIILDQLNIQDIKSKIQSLLVDYDFILFIEKSEFYPESQYNKLDYLKHLEDFNIINQTYFGSPELKFNQKELFLVVIAKNDLTDSKTYVRWEGYQFFHISLAVINRELEIRMIQDNKYEITIESHDYYQELDSKSQAYNLLNKYLNRLLLRKPDFHIRHVLPSNLYPPEHGRYILIFPWEAGAIPNELVNHINNTVDELWCPSEYIKQLHINSGVLKRKIQVIPNGIDLDIFNPETLNKGNNKQKIDSLIKNTKKFKFLFVGGILFRKGLDLLLEAYLSEFTANDDVSLIIKGLGKNTYYSSDKVAQLIDNRDKNKAEIILIEDNLNETDLASLYSLCDAYIHPYRAEGFGMPIFEAMACGTVPIVTNYGPSLEYCNNSNSFLIDYEFKENIAENTFIEPDINHIKTIMRFAYNNPDIVKNKSQKAVDTAQVLSWNNIFKTVEQRLEYLKKMPEYRTNKDYYIEILTNQINIEDNSHILEEIKFLADNIIYQEIYAKERIYNQAYKQALNIYTNLFNTNKDKKYLSEITKLLELLGDTKTANKLKDIRD